MSDTTMARRILPRPMAAPTVDLLRALMALRPREEATLAAILDALGHSLELVAVDRPRPVVPPPVPRTPNNTPRKKEPASEGPARRSLPSDIAVLESEAALAPPWMATATLLQLSADPGAVFRMPVPPLLDPKRQRALLVHAAARRRPEGELDLERMTLAVAECRPLRELPRRPITSLRRGALLLCDTAPGMDPFAMDIAALTEAIVAAVGRDRLRVARFYGCPLNGLLRWDSNELDPWRPPPEGMSVLVLTDLSATRVPGVPPTPAHSWLKLQTELRRRGSRLTVLFPGAASRVPASLRGRLRVLPLDQATGVRAASGTRR